ncbi:hypothetical protein K435DRAFT_777940 [Dendrothele bispora CBS 962.96]|uniref:Uncharacterized protein n=1 Tax=Dendrothele bispora (strain CBS 962.96) TaxID=1314807 RepID=A0A4S8M6C4_DENBC|nr:hypothetical protein K435DRAFT_777940 [Dendrothele bispora CBS 962.96]
MLVPTALNYRRSSQKETSPRETRSILRFFLGLFQASKLPYLLQYTTHQQTSSLGLLFSVVLFTTPDSPLLFYNTNQYT